MFIDKNLNVNELGNLTIAGVDTIKLSKKFKTPLYVIDENYFEEQCQKLKKLMLKFYGENSLVCYASKAFCCKEIYRILKKQNLGADVVSDGELFTAIEAGFDCDKIFFHGNSKTEQELEFAIKNHVGKIVVDNLDELNLIEQIASKLNVKVNILIRVKPGVDAHVHKFIRTGQIDSKFGFAISTGEAMQAVKQAKKFKFVNLVGAHCHIGSQILEIEPFVLTVKIMLQFFYDVKKNLNCEFLVLNLGGGFGINYLPQEQSLNIEECFKQICLEIKHNCKNLNLKEPFLVIEPGRFLIAKAGLTLYRVSCVKKIPNIKTYVCVDGGMTDNPRFALYGAKYDVSIANRANFPKTEIVSIAGKCCESGDLICENVKLQKAACGDVLAVFATGAYNYSMASNYNKIAKPAVVFVKNLKARIVVKRETLFDLIKNDL